MSTDIAAPAARGAPPRIAAERLFFTAVVASMLAAVVVGFAPTYYLAPVQPPPPSLAPYTPLVHLHGALFSGWIALLTAQTAFVMGGRRDLHRKLGVIGFFLVLGMIPVGVITALYQVLRASGPPGVRPLTWLAMPLFSVAGFAPLFVAGLALRREPAAHKRLMILGTAAMISAAFGRIALIPTFVGILVAPAAYVVAIGLWDLVTRRRLHPATLWGGLVVLAVTIGPIFIWRTPAWQSFAAWAVGLIS